MLCFEFRRWGRGARGYTVLLLFVVTFSKRPRHLYFRLKSSKYRVDAFLTFDSAAVKVPAAVDCVPLFVRAGTIVPLIDPSVRYPSFLCRWCWLRAPSRC